VAVVGAAVVVAVVEVVFLLRNVFRATMPCTFEHLNFQKRSELGGFVRFDFGMSNAAARVFWTSQLPKVL
jgi:hypothetical protein